MSGPPPGGPPRPMSIPNGPPSAGMPPQQQMPPQPVGPPAGAAPQTQQNLNQIVLEYLSKKGYNRTEAVLRQESANQDAEGRPIINRAEQSGGRKYYQGFELLRVWVEDNLDIYKAELRKTLWPIFVYSIIDMAADYYSRDCEAFYNSLKDHFVRDHEDEVRKLATIRTPKHVEDSQLAQLFRKNKYRITMSHVAFNNLIQFLESKDPVGGAVVIAIIQQHINIHTYDRANNAERSIAAILARGSQDQDMPDEDEGIPGHNPGSANTDPKAPPVLAKLSLGPLAPEPELEEDLRAELTERDIKDPPKPGQPSLVEVHEQMIKREPDEDGPPRETIPLPPSLARDVAMEVQKVIEHRDRFKIEKRTSGISPGVSVTMFTFHNTFDSLTCIDFSGDNELVAAGSSESYVRVWTMSGNALPPAPNQPPNTPPSSSRRLIGHSGPVYAVSFSPSSARPDPNGPSTAPRYLLSASADKTVRLWSLETWSCLVAYRGHDSPVWDVQWGPHGHYFLTGGADRTARLWTTSHIEAHKWFVGHDGDVDCIAWHPNGGYVFTGSSDKSVRMWHVGTGNALRMFTGHTGAVTALACSPDGRTLASADDQGAVILWDLEKGRRRKRMRGHAKGGVWSLAWSVESSVLVSAGADASVRVWDVRMDTPDSAMAAATAANSKPGADGAATGTAAKVDGKVDGVAGAGAAGAAAGAAGATSSSSSSAAAAGGGKKTKASKENVVTPDQISAFPTKHSPVYKVAFTRMNLVLAGGAYLPPGAGGRT